MDVMCKNPQMTSTATTFDTASHNGFYGCVKEVALNPQPTNDPLDPLNFPKPQKYVALGIVMWMYFLFTYLTTTTVPSFALLQEQYSITFAQVNWTVAVPALGLSLGPLIWSSLADIYGRRTVLISGTLLALCATIWSGSAKGYSSYMSARLFQGLGVSPAATVGMAVINDMFFEHERGHKLGLWTLAIDLGLLIGPLVGGFVTLLNQYWVAWTTAILFAILLVLQLFFLPETLYPRLKMIQSSSCSGSEASKRFSGSSIKRTRQLGFLNLSKIPGVEHPSPWDATIYFLKMWSFPNIAVLTFFYCFAWYWWILSVITYIPAAYPEYRPQIQGLLFGGLILGTLLSELCCSGTVSDNLVTKLAIRNGGIRLPEMRLWMLYPAIVISSAGLILWGLCIDQKFHWLVGQLALFLFAAGIQIGNTTVAAYLVDCYPKHGMSVVVFYAVLLNMSAFVNPFFIAPWVDSIGFTWTFSAQGIITLCVMVPVTAILQTNGGSWRERRGHPAWTSPEYS